jgi:hypothetical protein
LARGIGARRPNEDDEYVLVKTRVATGCLISSRLSQECWTAQVVSLAPPPKLEEEAARYHEAVSSISRRGGSKNHLPLSRRIGRSHFSRKRIVSRTEPNAPGN